MSYKQVAFLIGRPEAWRTVGSVLNTNKNLKIPCHRVIKSDGKIGGYRYGMRKKINLLRKEGVNIIKGKVALPPPNQVWGFT